MNLYRSINIIVRWLAWLLAGSTSAGFAFSLIPDVTNPSISSRCATELVLSWQLPEDFNHRRNVVIFASDQPVAHEISPSMLAMEPEAQWSGDYGDGRLQCVYKGRDRSVAVQGLDPSRSWHFLMLVVEMEGDTLELSHGLRVGATTPAFYQPITQFNASSVQGNLDLTWMNPDGCGDRILIVARESKPVDEAVGAASLRSFYHASMNAQTNWAKRGNANDLYHNTLPNSLGRRNTHYIVYLGAADGANKVRVTNTDDSKIYHFKVFTMLGTFSASVSNEENFQSNQWSEKAGTLEIQVGDFLLTPDQITAVDLGETLLGEPVVHECLIRNASDRPIPLTTPILPMGFELDGSFPALLEPGESDAFRVRLSASDPGAFFGRLEIGWGDEWIFYVPVSCTVKDVRAPAILVENPVVEVGMDTPDRQTEGVDPEPMEGDEATATSSSTKNARPLGSGSEQGTPDNGEKGRVGATKWWRFILPLLLLSGIFTLARLLPVRRANLRPFPDAGFQKARGGEKIRTGFDVGIKSCKPIGAHRVVVSDGVWEDLAGLSIGSKEANLVFASVVHPGVQRVVECEAEPFGADGPSSGLFHWEPVSSQGFQRVVAGDARSSIQGSPFQWTAVPSSGVQRVVVTGNKEKPGSSWERGASDLNGERRRHE